MVGIIDRADVTLEPGREVTVREALEWGRDGLPERDLAPDVRSTLHD